MTRSFSFALALTRRGSLHHCSAGNGSKKRKRSESEGGPLVIPSVKDRDWRELARRRRGGVRYVPGQGRGATSNTAALVGQDSINTGPVLVGLQVKTKTKGATTAERRKDGDGEVVVLEETEDQRALRLILDESSRDGDDEGGGRGVQPVIESISMLQPGPITEAEAVKQQDVEELPDPASLEDYERVPVAQFGAALLRGMGWDGKEDRPYLPEARPALLGIGAKEQEQTKSDKRRVKAPYVPVKQVTRSGTGTSTPVSR